MRIFRTALLAAAFASPALAAEDPTVTTSATEAVGNAIAAQPLREPKTDVAEDTESLFSDVHGPVSVMVGTGGHLWRRRRCQRDLCRQVPLLGLGVEVA